MRFQHRLQMAHCLQHACPTVHINNRLRSASDYIPFYLYISISLQILVLFKLHQLFNFGGTKKKSEAGLRNARAAMIKPFLKGFKIHIESI